MIRFTEESNVRLLKRIVLPPESVSPSCQQWEQVLKAAVDFQSQLKNLLLSTLKLSVRGPIKPKGYEDSRIYSELLVRPIINALLALVVLSP